MVKKTESFNFDKQYNSKDKNFSFSIHFQTFQNVTHSLESQKGEF